MNPSAEIIMGIDPGTLVTGYGIILADGNRYTPLDYGCITPPAKFKLSERYEVIYDSVNQLIEKHRPTVLVIETQFIGKNVNSILKLTMVRGIIMIAAKKNGVAIYEYGPKQAKKAVVGHGSASKFQVQGMVQRLLNLGAIPQPDDAADALALAICYAQHAIFLRPAHEI